MSESSEARRKRLKAMLASAQDADGEGGGGGGGLANPFADEGGPSTNSGPFTFFRCGILRQSYDLLQADVCGGGGLTCIRKDCYADSAPLLVLPT